MLLAATLAISAVATTTAAAKPAKPAASSDIKVGLVTDIAGLGDKSFNFLAGEGLKQAEKKYGIQGDVTVSKSNSDYVPNITKYALKGYDLIIAVGFLEEQAVGQVAKKFPDDEVRDHRRQRDASRRSRASRTSRASSTRSGRRATSSATSRACSRSRTRRA